MAIDPSIALGYRGIEVPNPLNQFAQVQQLQSNEMKMQEAMAANQERNALRKLDPAAADYENQLFKVNPQLGIQFRKERTASEASQAMAAQHKAEAAAKRAAFAAQGERDLARNPSNANITAWLEDTQASDLFTAQEKAAAAKQAESYLAMPVAKRAAAMQMRGASTGDYTSRRGQDMTDARARDRLAAETATGDLSPQTIDFVAETYRQTGQLPPLGMGKAAVNMRQKVLDRAAQLAMGTGDGKKTAAEAASDVKTAKADTAAQAGTVKDFSSGMSARKVTANNTAINHLATMEKLADDLANNDTRVFNAAANAIGKQFGTTAPTNFDAARQLVASEVIKAVVANGGGVTERQEAQEQFARANSPAQLKGVINTYRELLGGQLSSLGQQYETGTGRKDFNKKLSPETAKILEKAAPASGVDTKNPLLN